MEVQRSSVSTSQIFTPSVEEQSTAQAVTEPESEFKLQDDIVSLTGGPGSGGDPAGPGDDDGSDDDNKEEDGL